MYVYDAGDALSGACVNALNGRIIHTRPWIANLNWYCFSKGTAARDDICFAPVNGHSFDWCPVPRPAPASPTLHPHSHPNALRREYKYIYLTLRMCVYI